MNKNRRAKLRTRRAMVTAGVLADLAFENGYDLSDDDQREGAEYLLEKLRDRDPDEYREYRRRIGVVLDAAAAARRSASR